MLFENCAEETPSQASLTQSQFNRFLGKLQEQQQGEEPPQNEVEGQKDLQSLIYNTLMLDYDLFLQEQELKYYKIILSEKEIEIKKLKEMHCKKNSKLISVVESLKRVNKKIKEVSQGYKIMTHKKVEYQMTEQSHRNERLTCQQQKNKLYNYYCQLEQKHGNLLAQIDNYDSVETDYNQLRSENQQLREQIDNLDKRKKQLDVTNPNSKKEELKASIKKLYQKIKMAEKQDQKICKEYQTKKKRQKAIEQEQNIISQRNIQINSLFTKMATLKEQCKQKKWQKLEKDKQYHQLLAEQSQIKKQIPRYQPHSPPKQSKLLKQQKPEVFHNFKIIDSEADQQIHRIGHPYRTNSKKRSPSSGSQEQFDQLIDRFQKIKSKSKNLS